MSSAAGMPEETILLAAASILRKDALDRISRVQEELRGLDAADLGQPGREAILRAVAADLGIASAAAKAADGIDDVIREASAAAIREELG